ncbi:unnamed protein product [Phytophthora lilii]|uniref:cellulose 1,4-beta-cellobiosidase (non-reducing end) n=1 Tax=Phytophthora lilii TaxID=2077276 RepID=A0A9W6YDD0_9STRA|nr:unnamed protein product [Phytophthora lilii]
MKLSTTTIGLTAAVVAFIGTVAQQPGTNVPEKHPSLPTQVCKDVLAQVDQVETDVVKCVTEESSVVIDADWRDMIAVGTTHNSCNADSKWNMTTCSTPKECAKNCGLEDDWRRRHTRVMLDASGKKYKQFQLLNQEFTFDVDMSLLPCGSNGALYFSKMDADGGTQRFPVNTAGGAYGTGYCDAQYQKSVKFINGEADLNSTEMDIWRRTAWRHTSRHTRVRLKVRRGV